MKIISLPLGLGGEPFQIDWVDPNLSNVGEQLAQATEFVKALEISVTALALGRIAINLQSSMEEK